MVMQMCGIEHEQESARRLGLVEPEAGENHVSVHGPRPLRAPTCQEALVFQGGTLYTLHWSGTKHKD